MQDSSPIFHAQPYEKVEQIYFKTQKHLLRHNITRIMNEGFTYNVSFGAKKDNLLSDNCQLIASIDSQGQYHLGYAFESDGFPYDQTCHPIFKDKVSFDELNKLIIEGNYICIELQNQDKPWKFKFQQKSLVHDWMKLIEQMRSERLKNAGQMFMKKQSREKEENKVETEKQEAIRSKSKTVDLQQNRKQQLSRIAQITEQSEYTTGKTQRDMQNMFIHTSKSMYDTPEEPEYPIGINSPQKNERSEQVSKQVNPPSVIPEIATEDEVQVSLSEEELSIIEDEVYKQKCYYLDMEYKGLTVLVEKKNKQIDHWNEKIEKEGMTRQQKQELEGLITARKEKDQKINELLIGVDKQKIQEYEISIISSEFEDEKKKSEELQRELALLQQQIAQEKAQKEEEETSEDPQKTIKFLKAEVESRAAMIKMLNNQNRQLRQKVKSQEMNDIVDELMKFHSSEPSEKQNQKVQN